MLSYTKNETQNYYFINAYKLILNDPTITDKTLREQLPAFTNGELINLQTLQDARILADTARRNIDSTEQFVIAGEISSDLNPFIDQQQKLWQNLNVLRKDHPTLQQLIQFYSNGLLNEPANYQSLNQNLLAFINFISTQDKTQLTGFINSIGKCNIEAYEHALKKETAGWVAAASVFILEAGFNLYASLSHQVPETTILITAGIACALLLVSGIFLIVNEQQKDKLKPTDEAAVLYQAYRRLRACGSFTPPKIISDADTDAETVVVCEV